MPDFHGWIPIVKSHFFDLLGPKRKFSIFCKNWFIFRCFSLKTRKYMPVFFCLNSYCKIIFFRFFWAQANIFILLSKLLNFPFFSPNNKKLYARFSMLDSRCKIALFRLFGAQQNVFAFWSKWLHFPFLFLQKQENVWQIFSVEFQL